MAPPWVLAELPEKVLLLTVNGLPEPEMAPPYPGLLSEPAELPEKVLLLTVTAEPLLGIISPPPHRTPV